MANVTYLIGAGASAGKRDKGKIIEGLPCVNEIPTRILNIIEILKNNSIPKDIKWFNSQLGLNSKLDWENARIEVLKLFQDLHLQCTQHATIDTYAKKLKLRKLSHEFKKLEQLLTLFFLFEQILSKTDSRYDTFLANILEDSLQFPENIRILSWNYDCQIELAYDGYNQRNGLTIGDKLNERYQDYEIIKINGTAAFQNQESLIFIREKIAKEIQQAQEDPISVHLAEMRVYLLHFIYLYKLYVVGKKDNTKLSFAFDYTTFSKNIVDCINTIVDKTDALVIIGYTFPFFNREIDRKILLHLKPNTKIYIQDIHPERIKQSLEAITPTIQEENIVLLREVDQFYLPPEL